MDINKKVTSTFKSLGVLKTNEPLKKYTSFKTGGPSDIIIWPKNRDALKEIILLSKNESLPVTVLGGCSNLLVGDKGIRGVVIMLNSMSKIKGRITIEDSGLIYCDAGVRKDEFLRFCVDAGFSGMEFMAGVPGCIGGGIIMNAGTVDGNFADIISSVVCMSSDGVVSMQTIAKEAAGYRTMGIPDRSIVLGGFFRLRKEENRKSVKEKIESILRERMQKHPLDYPSAGSVFKNPPGHSSWKLIDDAGLKGKSIGGARVSELHTNFIINAEKAMSRDIVQLIDYIRETVFLKFNISLDPEIRIIGEF
ncbi:MAG: UDP-N-acetylmuramate dehydrogenase [Spirochaetes bacterium]|nr:UDP-N-acetylmuramate dehydrogenase [Spirochaetota bacterium]